MQETMSRKQTTVSTLEMSREEWLRLRQKGIGSSDVGAILGFNKYKTPLEVYHEKISEELLDTPMTAAMEFGLKLEQVVADTYVERTGRKVIRDNKVRIHPEFPFMLCNLDRIILPENGDGRGILEIKTASGFAAKHFEDEIPINWYAQVQHQFFVTGLTWGAIAVLVDGRDFRIVDIRRDDDYIESQNKALFRFWIENVQQRVPPTATVKDIEIIRAEPGSVADATPDIINLVEQLKLTRASIAELDIRKTDLEDRIKLFMGTREVLADAGTTLVTWKTSKDSESIDTKRLKKELPDVAAKYSVTKPGTRRFVVKEGGEE